MTAGSPLTLAPSALATVRARLDAFLEGSQSLTGLDLYLLLERNSSLVQFHTVMRLGPLNRTRSGLQQSYGDHNRLLLLGLDRLEAADLAWYRGRLEPASDVADDDLLDCFAAVRSLGLTAPLRTAMWLAAALHDCGMLGGQGAGVDVEDGVALARQFVRPLCPEDLQDLACFVVRNHDYVKDVFLGEIPASFIAAQVEALPPSLRATALAALGMVQVAGAASLGDGRLSRFRVEIFRRCLDGRVLTDRSAGTRLARLLDPPQLDVPETGARSGDAAIENVTNAAPGLRRFLEHIPLHGWHRAWRRSGGSPQGRHAVLGAIASAFDAGYADHDHAVIGETVDFTAANEASWRPPACKTVELRNGTRAMLMGDA